MSCPQLKILYRWTGMCPVIIFSYLSLFIYVNEAAWIASQKALSVENWTGF